MLALDQLDELESVAADLAQPFIEEDSPCMAKEADVVDEQEAEAHFWLALHRNDFCLALGLLAMLDSDTRREHLVRHATKAFSIAPNAKPLRVLAHFNVAVQVESLQSLRAVLELGETLKEPETVRLSTESLDFCHVLRAEPAVPFHLTFALDPKMLVDEELIEALMDRCAPLRDDIVSLCVKEKAGSFELPVGPLMRILHRYDSLDGISLANCTSEPRARQVEAMAKQLGVESVADLAKSRADVLLTEWIEANRSNDMWPFVLYHELITDSYISLANLRSDVLGRYLPLSTTMYRALLL